MLTRFDPPIIKVDAAGKLVKAFGQGMFKSSHGFCMDRDGNLWGGDRASRQVHKFSQDGKHLMSVGTPEGAESLQTLSSRRAPVRKRRTVTCFGITTTMVRIGNARTGSIVASFETPKTEGIGADPMGNLYVGPGKYVRVK